VKLGLYAFSNPQEVMSVQFSIVFTMLVSQLDYGDTSDSGII